MKAVKANKEYTIAEQDKNRYIAEGYDIVDDDGHVIAYGRGKTVAYEVYKKVLDELNELKAEKSDAEKSSAEQDDVGKDTSKKTRAVKEA